MPIEVRIAPTCDVSKVLLWSGRKEDTRLLIFWASCREVSRIWSTVALTCCSEGSTSTPHSRQFINGSLRRIGKQGSLDSQAHDGHIISQPCLPFHVTLSTFLWQPMRDRWERGSAFQLSTPLL